MKKLIIIIAILPFIVGCATTFTSYSKKTYLPKPDDFEIFLSETNPTKSYKSIGLIETKDCDSVSVAIKRLINKARQVGADGIINIQYRSNVGSVGFGSASAYGYSNYASAFGSMFAIPVESISAIGTAIIFTQKNE